MKGYHVYQTGRWANFFFEREAHNPHSEVPIASKIDGSIIVNISDCLAAVLALLLDSGRVANTAGTITGLPKSSPD